MFAAKIRKKRVERLRSGPEWQWNLDEMFVKINGERHYLWRAVHQEGEVLESFVTKTRDKKAALKFLKKTTKRFGRPHIFVTDKLRSYGAALREVGAADRQETGRWRNNRAENSQLPFRRRERAMQRFRRNSGVGLFPFPIEHLLVPQLVLSTFSGQVQTIPPLHGPILLRD
ncbi:DDE domain-containing protein [Aliiruegeria lutimaris]|uniref:DDE domain-containing protein n=1 Tax=Aliiruegeria lutimaris TaxID=571298 RepID=A0A1G9QPM9_9RHOB|nr:DDE domain-containing protein [Aliiruegeria lutimaris]